MWRHGHANSFSSSRIAIGVNRQQLATCLPPRTCAFVVVGCLLDTARLAYSSLCRPLTPASRKSVISHAHANTPACSIVGLPSGCCSHAQQTLSFATTATRDARAADVSSPVPNTNTRGISSSIAAAQPQPPQPDPQQATRSGAQKVRCAGCGAGLQTRDQAAAGYIPTHKKLLELQQRTEDALAAAAAQNRDDSTPAAKAAAAAVHEASLSGHGVICQRCFNAKHYGRLMPLAVPEAVYSSYLRTLASMPAEKSSLVVLVLDCWDFHGAALTSTLRALLAPPPKPPTQVTDAMSGSVDFDRQQQNPPSYKRPSLLVVINKVDLLPNDVKQERVLQWAREELRIAARMATSKASGAGAHHTAQDDADAPDAAAAAFVGSLSEPTGSDRVLTLNSNAFVSPSAKKRFDKKLFDAENYNSGGGGSKNRRTDNSRDGDGGGGRTGGSSALGGGIVGVHLVSAQKGWGTAQLLDDIKGHYKGRDVYVVGAPNVGKSSVINALLAKQWGLPWTSTGAVRRGAPSATAGGAAGSAADGARPGQGRTVTLFLDELPPGYKVGDVFKGDFDALQRSIRSRVHGQAGNPVMDRDHDAASSSPSGASSGSSGDAASAAAAESREILSDIAARKARHKATKESIVTGAADFAADAGADDSRHSVTVAVDDSASGGGGAGNGASATSPKRNASSAPAPPAVPFTTSPLPGTTLGERRDGVRRRHEWAASASSPAHHRLLPCYPFHHACPTR